MPALSGSYLYSVDHKGRLSLPAKIRKLFQGRKGGRQFTITRGQDGCLFVFPASEWEQVLSKLRELRRFETKARFFIRTIMANAAETELDAQGRITIPQSLLQVAKIKDEVLILGALDRIELWNPDIYRKYGESSGLTYEEAAEDLLL